MTGFNEKESILTLIVGFSESAVCLGGPLCKQRTFCILAEAEPRAQHRLLEGVISVGC